MDFEPCFFYPLRADEHLQRLAVQLGPIHPIIVQSAVLAVAVIPNSETCEPKQVLFGQVGLDEAQ